MFGEKWTWEGILVLPGASPARAWLCPPQMLLEKLNGTVPCLLDTSTIPAEELTMSTSRSVANSGLSESLAPIQGTNLQKLYGGRAKPRKGTKARANDCGHTPKKGKRGWLRFRKLPLFLTLLTGGHQGVSSL